MWTGQTASVPFDLGGEGFLGDVEQLRHLVQNRLGVVGRMGHFAVDGVTVLQTPFSPRGALGFVTWLDNQYAIVTPQGKLGFGIVPVAQEQTLLLEQVTIEPL